MQMKRSAGGHTSNSCNQRPIGLKTPAAHLWNAGHEAALEEHGRAGEHFAQVDGSQQTSARLVHLADQIADGDAGSSCGLHLALAGAQKRALNRLSVRSSLLSTDRKWLVVHTKSVQVLNILNPLHAGRVLLEHHLIDEAGRAIAVHQRDCIRGLERAPFQIVPADCTHLDGQREMIGGQRGAEGGRT